MRNWVLKGWLILIVAITACGILSGMLNWPWLWNNFFYFGVAFVLIWGTTNIIIGLMARDRESAAQNEPGNSDCGPDLSR